MKAYQYTGPAVEDVWSEVLPLIELGLSPGYGEKSPENLREDIFRGVSQLFIWRDDAKIQAAIVTSLVDHPQYKVVFVEAMAGRGAIQILKDYWESLCAWARANGCVAIEGATQPATTRLLEQHLGYRKVYDVVRYSLERPNVCQ